MKRILLSCLSMIMAICIQAQITRLSNNTSYDLAVPLTNTKIILRSAVSNTLWVHDVPGNSFTELSAAVTIEQDHQFQVMNGTLYFAGKTAAEGIELWSTDGTPAGTTLVKDINPGPSDSGPRDGFTIFSNELYFSADDGASGRELWKTNGTSTGTVRVKDINPGSDDAFPSGGGFPAPPSIHFAQTLGVLVFTAASSSSGGVFDVELWKTDGTETGTSLLLDIYTGTDPSYISSFTELGTDLLFTAFDPVNGDALWKTNGSVAGTVMIKDIDPSAPMLPPFYFIAPSITASFFNFQNALYFVANDATAGFELWKTDGTTTGTDLVKDINPGLSDAFPFGFGTLALAVKKGSKFFFAATTDDDGTELWESDGTGPGTQLLKDIAPGATSSDALTIPNFLSGDLFQGDKFFLVANTPAEGGELWISDGTAAGTQLVKDINPGFDDGIAGSYLIYTDSKVYFTATDGTHGEELWQTDGTELGTSLVQDINSTPTPAENSDMQFATAVSNSLFFFGTDGDDANLTDFFKLDLSAAGPLPLHWISFEARPSRDDILLQWKTADEEKTDHFIVQRSSNGSDYLDLARVTAVGFGSNSYDFSDANAMKAGVSKWYYRIKYVDIDGKTALSRVALVVLGNPIVSLQILPNPVLNKLNLLIESAGNDRAVICVSDLAGRTVIRQSATLNRGRNNVSVDSGQLPNGPYLLQIIMQGSMTTTRFLVQR